MSGFAVQAYVKSKPLTRACLLYGWLDLNRGTEDIKNYTSHYERLLLMCLRYFAALNKEANLMIPLPSAGK